MGCLRKAISISFLGLLGATAVLIACLVWLAEGPSQANDGSGDGSPAFGASRVWSIDLSLTPDEFAAMQPIMPGPFGPPPGPAQPRNPVNRPTERNLFGVEFPWARANVTIDGQTLRNVGLRYSGEITYLTSSMALKRPLRLGFDRFGGDKWREHSGLQLQAMPMDPSKARQVMAGLIFRAAGVPTPRTAFAEVTLSVPGRYDREYLGLYTVVEELDGGFLRRHFGSDRGVLFRPFGSQNLPYLGENWEAYRPVYRPHREVTPAEARRLIEFTSLVHRADENEFQRRIGEFIDTESFLRYLTAHVLTAQLESFFALGHNYALYLDPQSSKFHLLPGDMEFALGNFLLFGNADQLADLSIRKPYPGECRLVERLLRTPGVAERYSAFLRDQLKEAFSKEGLSRQLDTIEQSTKLARDKEAQAVRNRREPQGFGGAGGFGPPAPQPPDLMTFVERRIASITAQLAGNHRGFEPQPLTFGPNPGGGPNNPGGFGLTRPTSAMDERTFASEVKGPPDFDLTLFAAPPMVNYPVAIACEPGGAIYVAVDEQGSLGRTPGGGRIVRLVDRDGDGKADGSTVFARVDHPRGVAYRNGKLWVCHPPTLSVMEDTDGDGVADKRETLVTGLTTRLIRDRGGDHTTNCVRFGIDGWLYIGVGDYGILEAKGKDGRTISLRGGGVVRVRPDGTELEIYCTGLRNPFDLAIDPFLNLFTRDNTNDGGGWDTRVSHLWQTAEYGYPRLFANFTDEIMPTLGSFGNGGGSGAVMVSDARWPTRFRGMLLTSDWGRSEVYLHPLRPRGATFDLRQEVFLTIPRPTGMDVDAHGRLYVASWRGGSAVGFEGPNIGFVAAVTPRGLRVSPLPELKKLSTSELVEQLRSTNGVWRLHVQGEILSRGRHAATTEALVRLVEDDAALLESRVAALFTLKQLDEKEADARLLRWAGPGPLRPFALRAMTDRQVRLGDLPLEPFVAALADSSPRVQAQALISLGRIGNQAAAASILPLTLRPKGSEMPRRQPVQNQPDPDRVVPHLAVRALVALEAVEACLEALDGPYASGALWALRSMHRQDAVEGLIRKLNVTRTPELRRDILMTLIRLYYREADYDGSWWGIRPDTTGPYYDPVEWKMTRRIAAVLTAAWNDADKETAAFLREQLRRHRVQLPGVTLEAQAEVAQDKPIVLPQADPNNPDQIANLPYETVVRRALAVRGDARRGEQLFKSQSCFACHTTADGQTPKGPHLVDIGKRYQPEELVESIVKPSAKIAQGYESYLFATVDGQVIQGFVVSERAQATLIREPNGLPREIRKEDIESRSILKQSAMPDGLVANLTPEQLADLLAYLQSLKGN
ncbi:MAG: CotH kinase family protein [Gemmatales bacterium]|nr:CotH kinase family protein [Gemmatales bacterium]MDW8388406.1 CotH kinase family protein [Gemmatales bacterium]